MTESENKKGFFQNDRLLVCSMLIFYGVCGLGLIGLIFWGLNRRTQTAAAYATSTAIVLGTQSAQSTATAIVRSTELAGYEIIDRFDTNANHWFVGDSDSSYWKGSTAIKDGVYMWYVEDVKKGFIDWADFPGNDYIKNYDTYIDTKIESSLTSKDCSGLIFRKAPLGWDTGGYTFMVCNGGYFNVYYHNYESGWQKIASQYHSSIRPLDWNRLEVSANGSYFVFRINNQVVYETDDDRQATGGVALIIDVDDPETNILFDNFGYQTR